MFVDKRKKEKHKNKIVLIKKDKSIAFEAMKTQLKTQLKNSRNFINCVFSLIRAAMGQKADQTKIFLRA